MKNILFCTVPFSRNPSWFLPLGLLSVATSLKRNGMAVDVLDIDGERIPKEEVYNFLLKNQYKIIGISALTTQYNYTKWMVKVIKDISPQTVVVLGGNLSSSHPEFILRNTLVDICVFGEGEDTMPDLVNCLSKKGDLSRVKGIWYKENGEIRACQPRPLNRDLDRYCPLDYNLISLRNYLFPGSIISTRGCTHRCYYCFQPLPGVRQRGAQSLFEEINYLKKRYKIHFFSFMDSYFLGNKKFLFEFCRMIKKLRIRWDCNERLDQVDEEGLREMKDAGCISIDFGIESYNQNLLDEMNKKITLKQIEKGLQVAEKIKIKQINGSFIIGFFQESEETINRNINFAKRWKMSSCCFYLTPFPGTPLYKEARMRGFIPDEEKYFVEHIGRGDELESISKRFYLNMTSLSDEELINGYLKFQKELNTQGSWFFRKRQEVKLRLRFLSTLFR